MHKGYWVYVYHDRTVEIIAREQRWLKKKGVKTIYIEPGSPWENPFIESFNGTFRDECLNMNVFGSVKEAQRIAGAWRKDYNEARPHSSLSYMTPVEFARLHVPHRQAVKVEEERREVCRAGSSSQPTASFHFQHAEDLPPSFQLVQK